MTSRASADQSLAAELDSRLAGTWLTRDLSPAARETLATLGRIRLVTAGSVLTRETETTGQLSIVLDGRVALRMRVPERGQVTILTVEPGDVVGWSAVVPPFKATSTAVALVDAELATFDGPELRASLAADQQLAAELYPVLLRAVARRLEGTRLQLLDLFSQPGIEPW